jgi:hypothetical protein
MTMTIGRTSWFLGVVVKAGADDVVPECFDVEEERGAGVEAHT